MDLLFTRRMGETYRKADLRCKALLVSSFSCKDDFCCSHSSPLHSPTLIQLLPLKEREERCLSFAEVLA